MPRPARIPGAILLAASLIGTQAAAETTPKAQRQPTPALVPSPPPAGGPAPSAKPARESGWPRTLKDAKAVAAGGEPVPAAWTNAEIDFARARCAVLLQGLDAIVIPAAPIRDGACGAPAPVELVSLGKGPTVTFSPPVVVTCDMVAALDKWIRADMQPAARKHLGAPIVRIDTMSSYSCRNAYGRAKTRLSEHGRAKALDIRALATDRGSMVDLLADWGPTERDIQAQIAAAKAEAERLEAAKQVARQAQPTNGQPQAPQPTLRGSIAANPAPLPGTNPPASPPGGRILGFPGLGGRAEPGAIGLTPPNHLGGPKAGQPPKAPPATAPGTGAVKPRPAAPSAQARQQFLKSLHASACRTFMTTLGPEANEAHRNHFHIDLAERQSGRYCE